MPSLAFFGLLWTRLNLLLLLALHALPLLACATTHLLFSRVAKTICPNPKKEIELPRQKIFGDFWSQQQIRVTAGNELLQPAIVNDVLLR